MNFVKHNKFFLTIISLLFLLFFTLQFVSCNSDKNIELLKNDIQKEYRLQQTLSDEINNFQGLDKDAEFSEKDLMLLSQIEKDQQRFWENILNRSENIFTNWKNKSSESINADLTRFYTQLRDLCKRNNVYFLKETQNTALSFAPSMETKENKFGFGFSSYDGFWPSFSKEEAKLIGIQSKIVVTMMEYLSDSSDDEYGINLIKISREFAGKEDKQHIAGDLISMPNLSSKLVRFEDGIHSFAFSVEIKCHTSHARSFINQLRPPFLLRDLEVSRVKEGGFSPTQTINSGPFGEQVEMDGKQPLPIVKNVESTFTFLIEYIYSVERDLETFLKEELNQKKIHRESLKKFLEKSGNSKLESKLTKLLAND